MLEHATGCRTVHSNDSQSLATAASSSFERREIELLREQLGECRETIRDLRTRLDADAEERRRLIMLLTDRRPWWRRWSGNVVVHLDANGGLRFILPLRCSYASARM